MERFIREQLENVIMMKIDLLKASAEEGDLKSQVKLARMYYGGSGVPMDEEEAKKWFLKAADQCSDNELDNLYYL